MSHSTQTLDGIVDAYAQLLDLRQFKETAEPELLALRKEVSMLKIRVRDLRSKAAALEKRANVLSCEDESALYALNAEVRFTKRLEGGYTCRVRSGNRTIAKYHGTSPDLLKKAVTDARKRC